MHYLGVPLAFAATSLTAFAIARSNGGHKSGGFSSARDTGGNGGGSLFGATLRGTLSSHRARTDRKTGSAPEEGHRRSRDKPQLGMQDQIER